MSPIDVLNPSGTRTTARRAVTALAGLTTAAALLAACVSPKPPPPPPPAPVVVAPEVKCDPARTPEDLAASHLLASQERLSALNTADLAGEANKPADAQATIEQTMDQSLALSMTRTAGDLARAQGLLDQVLHNNAPQADPWRRSARLLAYRLAEQKRAEDLAERNAQQLRDAQRDGQRKLDQLNDKLEALKAIERSLNTRPGVTPPAASRPNP
jgi:hypothetical protein